MTIKEVCEKYELMPDTLRYYERVGVIPEVHRTKGGIRDYTEEDEKWVENAVCMRSAGVPVEMLIEYSAKNMQELAKGAKVINGKRFSSGASGDELGTWAKEYV